MAKLPVYRLIATQRQNYCTRVLHAGDEFEVNTEQERDLHKLLFGAKDAPPKRGPGRPRKQPAPAPEPAAPSAAKTDDLDDLTNAELMQRAKDRGLELPAGYIANEDLIARLRA